MAVKRLESGEPLIVPKNDGWFTLGCCDCNLTHRVDFKVTRSDVVFQFYRDERRTAQRRRREKEVLNGRDKNENT